jgi:hypothetical protein
VWGGGGGKAEANLKIYCDNLSWAAISPDPPDNQIAFLVAPGPTSEPSSNQLPY